ncbi:hypothetical protein THAOC_10391, partial [Thalassiosira oceanica]
AKNFNEHEQSEPPPTPYTAATPNDERLVLIADDRLEGPASAPIVELVPALPLRRAIRGRRPLPFRKDGRANPEWSQGQPRRASTGELPPPTDDEDDEASIRAATAMIAIRQRQSRQLSTGVWQPSAQSIFSFKRAFNATMASGGGSGSRIGVLDSPARAIARGDQPPSTATTPSPAADDHGQTPSDGGERDVTLAPASPAVRSRPQHTDSPASERTTSPQVASASWGEPRPNGTRSHQPRTDSPHSTLRRQFRHSKNHGHGRSPVHHPGYDLGQPGRESDMVLVPRPDIGRLAASFLRVHDGAFVRRTDGAWTYAIVAEVVPPSSPSDNNVEQGTSNGEDRWFTLRFVTDFDGSCKSISEGKWELNEPKLKQEGFNSNWAHPEPGRRPTGHAKAPFGPAGKMAGVPIRTAATGPYEPYRGGDAEPPASLASPSES